MLSLPLSLSLLPLQLENLVGGGGWDGVVEHPLKCEKLLDGKEEEKLKIHPE